ncbi:hypothetical protein L1987_01890 [Smallanthus sonchifolius]|uniref:Uncharacterized protein n=1 Tax=Smallanthus sonchifolius TaxID=185202 RepID=A0ACB9K672_9ASTR|nr:hypothetical protein L1987_01890 [Smallanthus sonchifolius]
MIARKRDDCLARSTMDHGGDLFDEPAFRSDEEPVDQKKYFEDLCKPKCVRAWLDYQGQLVVELRPIK